MSLTIIIHPGYTFAPGEAVTIDKLNALVSNGYATTLSGSVDTAMIADGSITNSKIMTETIGANQIATVFDLTGKTVTLPSTLMPKQGISPTLTVPDFIGQLAASISTGWYISYGLLAGQWQSINCLLVGPQWSLDTLQFPIKTTVDSADLLLIEDSKTSFSKKVVQVGSFLESYPANFKFNLMMYNKVSDFYHKMSIVFSEIILKSSTGTRLRALDGNLICDMTTAAQGGIDLGIFSASTWYYFYVIGKDDGTINCLASTNSLTPTLPAGYTFYRCVGECYSDASTHLTGIIRQNDIVEYNSLIDVYNNSTLNTTLTLCNIPIGAIPNGASEIHFQSSSSNATVPNSQVVSTYSTGDYPSSCFNQGVANHGTLPGYTGYGVVDFTMTHSGSQVFYARTLFNTTLGNQNLKCRGYLLER